MTKHLCHKIIRGTGSAEPTGKGCTEVIDGKVRNPRQLQSCCPSLPDHSQVTRRASRVREDIRRPRTGQFLPDTTLTSARHYADISEEAMQSNDADERVQIRISEVLRTLPLFDDLFLSMQALNLGVVDTFLMDIEHDLLREYMEKERTPIDTATFVSALSQLWIFGLYELLRTWRQRAQKIIHFADELHPLTTLERDERIAEQRHNIQNAASDPLMMDLHWRQFEKATNDDEFLESLSKAHDRIERLFRRIEALRMSLAKHEIPKQKESIALAPGYGRIDTTTGSIYWQVALRGNEVDMISRRAIADAVRELVEDRPQRILPRQIQRKLKKLPEHSYGVKRVAVVLEDKTEYNGVFVAWDKEVIGVHGFGAIPFDVNKVIDVRNDSSG